VERLAFHNSRNRNLVSRKCFRIPSSIQLLVLACSGPAKFFIHSYWHVGVPPKKAGPIFLVTNDNVTSASLGYPLSVFNKTPTLKRSLKFGKQNISYGIIKVTSIKNTSPLQAWVKIQLLKIKDLPVVAQASPPNIFCLAQILRNSVPGRFFLVGKFRKIPGSHADFSTGNPTWWCVFQSTSKLAIVQS